MHHSTLLFSLASLTGLSSAIPLLQYDDRQCNSSYGGLYKRSLVKRGNICGCFADAWGTVKEECYTDYPDLLNENYRDERAYGRGVSQRSNSVPQMYLDGIVPTRGPTINLDEDEDEEEFPQIPPGRPDFESYANQMLSAADADADADEGGADIMIPGGMADQFGDFQLDGLTESSQSPGLDPYQTMPVTPTNDNLAYENSINLQNIGGFRNPATFQPPLQSTELQRQIEEQKNQEEPRDNTFDYLLTEEIRPQIGVQTDAPDLVNEGTQTVTPSLRSRLYDSTLGRLPGFRNRGPQTENQGTQEPIQEETDDTTVANQQEQTQGAQNSGQEENQGAQDSEQGIQESQDEDQGEDLIK